MIKSKSLKVFGVFAIVLVLTMSIISFAAAAKLDNNGKQLGLDKDKKKRFIAKNDSQTQLALDNGCELVPGYKNFNVFLCDEKVGKNIPLIEDMIGYSADVAVNNAVYATQVQELGYTGKGVVIAVLDSGYNYNHPDLASSYLGGYDFVNKDNDPFDDNGHGSHVAGIITSDGIDSSSKGIAPDAKIVSVKVLNKLGFGYFSDIANGIYYSADNNVDVISISISTSSGYSDYCDNADSSIALVRDAINYAQARNINVIIAAGNTGANVGAPGCIESAFAVAATDNNYVIRSTSARGSMVDLYAPGTSVYSTVLGTSYSYKSGTSMSTPLVSGAIALLIEKNSELDYTEYEDAIIDGATILNADFGVMKILNVSSAINNIQEPFVCAQPNLSYSFVNGQFIVSFQSETGCQYNLEETTDLSSGNWLSIGIFDGNGQILQHKMYPDGPMRFFKISLV